jgi:hypothetical protein
MRTLFTVAIAILTMVIPVCVWAKGGYVRPPSVHVIAAVPLVVPHSLPSISAHEAFGGCGSHRQRDPETQKCRGPGNF